MPGIWLLKVHDKKVRNFEDDWTSLCKSYGKFNAFSFLRFKLILISFNVQQCIMYIRVIHHVCYALNLIQVVLQMKRHVA